MNTLQVLIVDDEPLICDELNSVLTAIPDVKVTGIAHNAQDAAKLLTARAVDVVFMDIHMPGMSGLELAKKLSRGPAAPLIVFVTAYSNFAVDAFSIDAVDYILKPFDEQDIDRVLTKVRWRQQMKGPLPSRSRGLVRKLCVEAGDRLEVIDVNRIRFIRADDRQVFIHTLEGQVFEVRRRLSELEEMLDTADFYRCHRNYIVNVNQIGQVASWFNRGYRLIMKAPPVEIPVGRVYAHRLKDYLLL